MTVESSQKLEVVTEDAEGSSFLLFAVVTFIEFGWLLAICLLVYLLYTPYFWITILAVLWQIWDRETPNRGGRRFPELRKSIYLRYLASYFPVQLKLTTTFEPENNYIFGYHPHGVVPLGSFCTFLTEALDISQKLPGMTIHYLTSHIVYLFPFLREFFMALGTSNVSEKNIRHLTKEKGNVVVIAIGGSAESMESTPGSTRLILRHRKGFVRMAIETGYVITCYGHDNRIDMPSTSDIFRSRSVGTAFRYRHEVYSWSTGASTKAWRNS